MSDTDNDAKQFNATEQKLRKAREKGDFPRSTEVNAALAYLGVTAAGGLAIFWAIPGWLNGVVTMWRRIAEQEIGQADIVKIWASAGLLTLVLVAVPAASIVFGLVVQRSLVFVPDKLALDFSRISPMKNARQKLGKSGLVTFAISVGKAIAVGVGGWILFDYLAPFLVIGRTGIVWVGGLKIVLGHALALALVVSLIFAIADLAWKHFDFRQRNRMSLKELKDEMKESEGDPYMKSARRQKSMEIVLNSMLADVEKADVIIVNPTHYAVALEWKPGSGRAPVCVAKGVGQVAMRIREHAGKYDVPVWPDPPCARAIHAAVKIGEEIEPDHFAAVAAAIRFAEAMRKKVRMGW
ncbi:MAG: flagellar type III secretion system protein FlhB [Paracoccus sp. (in: a-proteobacteria)]